MSHQTFIFFNSVFISCSRVLRSLAVVNTFVSSANILNGKIFEQFGRSFMYIKNNIGPRELSSLVGCHKLLFVSKKQYSPTEHIAVYL